MMKRFVIYFKKAAGIQKNLPETFIEAIQNFTKLWPNIK